MCVINFHDFSPPPLKDPETLAYTQICMILFHEPEGIFHSETLTPGYLSPHLAYAFKLKLNKFYKNCELEIG